MRRELLLTLLLALAAGCGGGRLPTAADVPEIMAETARGDAPGFGEAPARRAVRESLRRLATSDDAVAADVGKLFSRHELSPSYFLRDESHVGGTWPANTAKLLREVESRLREHADESDAFPLLLAQKLSSEGVPEDRRQALVDEIAKAVAERRRPLMEALASVRELVAEAARLYDMTARAPDSVKAMRSGLEISDDGLHAEFNRQVDVVNAARDRADAAFRALPPEHQKIVSRMRLAERVR